MRLSKWSGVAALVSLLALSTTTPGCGGGGGGGGGGGDCVIPGTLIALARQGQPAPGTGAGVYGVFDANSLAAVNDGGWTAFVADVVGGTTSRGLFVAMPDGSVRLVYSVGETLPEAPVVGTITDFERVFMTPGGVVVALVDGTAPAVGVLTARVDDLGAVVEKHGAVYIGDALPAGVSPIPGNLTAIDPDLLAVDDQGSIFFHGVGTGVSPVHGIYFTDRTGIPLGLVVATSDNMDGGGLCGTNFTGLAIDADGLVVAYAVDTTAGPTEGIWVDDGGTQLRVAANGDATSFTGGRTFEDVLDGHLRVSLSGSVTAVSWTGELSGGSPDLAAFIRVYTPAVAGSIETIAAPGQLAQGEPLGATYGNVVLLPMQQDPSRLTLQALITGGDTQMIFFSSPAAGTLNEIWREGTTLTGETGAFTTTYGSFGEPWANASDETGSVAFHAALSDASTGIFWAVRACGFFTVAKEGGLAPGGGTFSAMPSPTFVSTATNVVLFVAPTDLGTGLFRQG